MAELIADSVARIWSACNWAVGSFVVGSILMHEFCQRKRLLEKQGLKRAVEVIEQKRGEKQQRSGGVGMPTISGEGGRE